MEPRDIFSSAEYMENLDRILKSYVAIGEETKDRILGAAFIVVDKNGIVYEGSAGRIDLPVDSPPFTTDSFTWIASMTKIVTATCLMKLVEQKKFTLDDDARNLVPEVAEIQILRGFDGDEKPILEPNTKPITIRQLITHTAGLGCDVADPDLMKWSRAVGRTATIEDFSRDGFNTPVKFPPGEGWYYGSGPDWAAEAMLAAVGDGSLSGDSRRPLSSYMAEHVFEPLGMRDTTFASRGLQECGQVTERMVACSFRDPETGRLTTGPPPVPFEPPMESGGAGLWSTCADHAKVLRALLADGSDDHSGGGKTHTGRAAPSILSKQTVDEMLRPQLDETQRGMLKAITDMFRVAMVPEFEPCMPLDHGISGIINLQDAPGKRRAGSMMWMGMANGHWWIDRKTGIAGILFVNVLPQPDLVVNKMFDELERAVYTDLIF